MRIVLVYFLVDITNSGFVEIFIHKLHYKYLWLSATIEAVTSLDAMFQVLSWFLFSYNC